MVRFQIMSDLHMEMDPPNQGPQGDVYPLEITPQAPNLLLLGDIGYASHDRLYAWLDVQLRKFETVVFVPGNHGPSLIAIRAS